MFWADEIAASAVGPQVVNDSKTPSGTVHVGSLRGPVVVDTIARALRNASVPVELRYGVDDLDPMDAQALLTPDAIERSMGVPLAHVPDPADDGHPSYARHFAGAFVDTFDGLGIRPDTYYWMSEVYASGAMDRYIRLALDAAATIREIYRRVANVNHPDEWHPLFVVCEHCGRIGTTIVTGWDSERGVVHYECRPDLVEWATGCGHSGEVSPFGGRAKLPYNVDWAAKWDLFGVTIEPAGKDLSTKGGSRDRSDAIAREVFGNEPPLNVPYEFLNIGGRKMSTSRGVGASAAQMAEVVPPEQLRLLFLRPRPNTAIDFDPAGTDAIPRLFDESDRLAAATAGREVRGELPPHHDRVFAYSLVNADADVAAEAAAYRPAFSHLALLEQIPGIDVAERVTAEKGSPLTDRELEILDERRAAARAWLEAYAPDSARLSVHRERPARTGSGGRRRPAPVSRCAGRCARERRVGRRVRAGGHLCDRHRSRPAGREGICRAVPRIPRATVRTSRRLAARRARSVICDRPPAPGRRRRGGRMSVGLQRIREDADRLKLAAADKGEDPAIVDRAVGLDERRRTLVAEADALKAERNEASRRIGEVIRGGADPNGQEVGDLKAASAASAERIDGLDADLATVEAELEDALLRIPNPADPDVPVGGEEANIVVRTWGEPLPRGERKPHWELAESLGIIDNARGAKVTGSGWPVYLGDGSTLQRALIGWFLDVHSRENGMTEVWPPVVVNVDSARGTGQIPDKEDQMYVVERDGLYLVPTAEVPVTNLHRDEILDGEALPIRYAAYSASFRREAGAAGRDTRGILRVHQFDKVEMVSFSLPEHSSDELEWLTGCAETLLQRLGLAYRVVLMSTREMGFVQARKYDLEVWAPGVERWLEVSSISNFRDYQARRMAIRYRSGAGAKPELVHTLNGSGLALPRTVAALIETFQQPDGSIAIPEVLRPAFGGRDRIG